MSLSIFLIYSFCVASSWINLVVHKGSHKESIQFHSTNFLVIFMPPFLFILQIYDGLAMPNIEIIHFKLQHTFATKLQSWDFLTNVCNY